VRSIVAVTASCIRPILVLIISLLAACASNSPHISSELSEQLPRRHLIEGLPFYVQVEDQCGPASLATVLNARGLNVSPQDLRKKIYIPGKEGTLTTEMVSRARRYSMLVYPLMPELVDILAEVTEDNPVLILQNLGLDWAPRWHFSIAIGFDLDRDIIILRSGYEPYREVNVELFLKTWDRAQRWAVVVLLPNQLPATADAKRFLDAASELEQVGELEASNIAYQTAMTRWPSGDAAWFGAANTFYALGQFEQALGLYSAYLERQPSAAAGWNNMAYTLMQLQCRSESLQAIHCALQLEPEDPTWLDSLRELSIQAEITSKTSCSIQKC
jgi:tetratricopeptide (TPR) repeat protein